MQVSIQKKIGGEGRISSDIAEYLDILPKDICMKILVDYIGGWVVKKGKLVVDFNMIYSKIPKPVLYKEHDIYEVSGDEDDEGVFTYTTVKNWQLSIPINATYSYVFDYTEKRKYDEEEFHQEEIIVDNDDEEDYQFNVIVNPRGGSLINIRCCSMLDTKSKKSKTLYWMCDV